MTECIQTVLRVLVALNYTSPFSLLPFPFPSSLLLLPPPPPFSPSHFLSVQLIEKADAREKERLKQEERKASSCCVIV